MFDRQKRNSSQNILLEGEIHIPVSISDWRVSQLENPCGDRDEHFGVLLLKVLRVEGGRFKPEMLRYKPGCECAAVSPSLSSC